MDLKVRIDMIFAIIDAAHFFRKVYFKKDIVDKKNYGALKITMFSYVFLQGAILSERSVLNFPRNARKKPQKTNHFGRYQSRWR